MKREFFLLPLSILLCLTFFYSFLSAKEVTVGMEISNKAREELEGFVSYLRLMRQDDSDLKLVIKELDDVSEMILTTAQKRFGLMLEDLRQKGITNVPSVIEIISEFAASEVETKDTSSDYGANEDDSSVKSLDGETDEGLIKVPESEVILSKDKQQVEYDYLVPFSILVGKVRKTSYTYSWHESAIQSQFSINEVETGRSWSSKPVELVSLQSPNYSTWRVEPRKFSEILKDLKGLDEDMIAKKFDSEFKEGIKFFDPRSPFLTIRLYGSLGFLAVSEEALNVKKEIEKSFGLGDGGDFAVGFVGGVQFLFNVAKPLFLGIAGDYTYASISSLQVYDDVGTIKLEMKYSYFTISPMITLLFDNSRSLHHYISLLPGLIIGDWGYEFTFSEPAEEIKFPFIGYSLALEYDIFFGKYDYGARFGMGLRGGINYIPGIKDADGNTLYYQEVDNKSAYYLSDGSVILPHSKEAELFDIKIEILFLIEFNI
jgi:hypothetical protein